MENFKLVTINLDTGEIECENQKPFNVGDKVKRKGRTNKNIQDRIGEVTNIYKKKTWDNRLYWAVVIKWPGRKTTDWFFSDSLLKQNL